MTSLKKRNKAIIKAKQNGVTGTYIAKQYGISKQTVCVVWRKYLSTFDLKEGMDNSTT